MGGAEVSWGAVDEYLGRVLVEEDTALVAARESSRATTMPLAAVAANQGKLLGLLAEMVGARRVLEFGTLAGYSTIWLARAVGPHGRVTSFELDEANAAIARVNLDRAGVGAWVDVVTGPARASARRLIDAARRRTTSCSSTPTSRAIPSTCRRRWP